MDNRIMRKNSLESPKLIAHRGYAVEAPQNSIPAFVEAGKLGFWAIETDVHMTKDGVLVCNHNDSVDEMYDGNGKIAEMTYRELAALRIKTEKNDAAYSRWELTIPTFREYLAICKAYGCLPFIETKTGAIEEVINLACEFFPEEDVIISSVSLDHLEKAKEICSDVFVHHIFSNEQTMQRLSELGYCGVSYNCPDYRGFSPEILNRTHQAGVLCCLRAGDTTETVRGMIRKGLDYIPTNCIGNL